MIGRGRFCLGRLIAITDSLAVIFREQQIHALQKVVTLEPYVQIPILEDANAEIVALDHGWQRSAHACRIGRSEEHTSELQSLMRISYAVFCLKKKKQPTTTITRHSRH